MCARACAAIPKNKDVIGLGTGIALLIISALILCYVSIYACIPTSVCTNVTTVNYEPKKGYTLFHCNKNGQLKLAIPRLDFVKTQLAKGVNDIQLPEFNSPYPTVRRIIKCDKCVLITKNDCFKISCAELQ